MSTGLQSQRKNLTQAPRALREKQNEIYQKLDERNQALNILNSQINNIKSQQKVANQQQYLLSQQPVIQPRVIQPIVVQQPVIQPVLYQQPMVQPMVQPMAPPLMTQPLMQNPLMQPNPLDSFMNQPSSMPMYNTTPMLSQPNPMMNPGSFNPSMPITNFNMIAPQPSLPMPPIQPTLPNPVVLTSSPGYEEPSWSTPAIYKYRLRVIENGMVSYIELTGKNYLIIGRLQNCDISIPENASISRLHAVIQHRGGGSSRGFDELYIFDMNSTSGTFLNGQMLTPKTYYSLQP